MSGITRNKRVKRSRRNKKTSKRRVKYGGYAVPDVVKVTPKGSKITPKGTRITPRGTKHKKN
jgi:hypothetical protein